MRRVCPPGAITRSFKVTVTASVTAGANNVIGNYIAKNGTIVANSEIYITANSGGRAENVAIQTVVELTQNDYVEFFVENDSGTTNITVTDMAFIAEALNKGKIMADTVSTVTAYSNSNGEYVYRLTNRSDGTGESAVAKIDVSALTNADGAAGTRLVIDRIEWSISGFDYAYLYCDRTTDFDVAVLNGSGIMDFSYFGGLIDSESGGTGDLTLTTNGGSAGSAYDITIYFQVK